MTYFNHTFPIVNIRAYCPFPGIVFISAPASLTISQCHIVRGFFIFTLEFTMDRISLDYFYCVIADVQELFVPGNIYCHNVDRLLL
ncbi:hypothetical protein TK34_22060 (plasmid) [Aeromonas hydrophila]|nr:hypothetical protein TK34_22060 [Aeromonas hydrophila]